MTPLSISRRKPPVLWCEAGAIRIPGARATRPMKTLILLRFWTRSRGICPLALAAARFSELWYPFSGVWSSGVSTDQGVAEQSRPQADSRTSAFRLRMPRTTGR